ncbi:MBOAT family protein [Prevotella sp. S7 MS 2]|uniref:MBOAT family O-acyltransferase n=1 Tax=Prevotella sp. S7 MS 2 TaxID=1287488 RepID=UPI0018DCE2EE|nr:MBOAT family protein [Prevotella sp. S7 MS 2]
MFYYVLPSRFRNIFLLLASLGFYLCLKPIFALFLLWVMGTTYGFALLAESKRRMPTWVGICVSLLPLFFFKYYDFACSILDDLFLGLGSGIELPGLNWAIPVGISFYTFQALGYLIDVYSGKIKAEHNLLHHALFVCFFPQILSGPISRYNDLMPQIKNRGKRFDSELATSGIALMVWGMFLKVAVADRFGIYVDTVFGHPDGFSGLTLVFATLCYSIQIYTDFAGYSLLAIGCANVLGFRINQNFQRPYFSFGFGEFWRRWHITLSFWLRDYIYIPLGGSRTAAWKIRRNLFITFLVSGLWHGAAYTYLLWGLLHGLLVVVDRELRTFKGRCGRTAKAIGMVITFVLASLLWILFRVPTIKEALNILMRMVTDTRLTIDIPDNRDMKATVLTMFLMFMIVVVKDIRDEWCPNLFSHPKWIWVYSCVIGILILLFGVFDAGQFIYISF